jgi:hypothetical protein
VRLRIEFIFRDAKQFTGSSDCQARDRQAPDFHFNVARAEAQNLRLDCPLILSQPLNDIFSAFCPAIISARRGLLDRSDVAA